MVRTKGPLSSGAVSGNFDGFLQFRTKNGKTHVHAAPNPQQINQGPASEAQGTVRAKYAQLAAEWNAMDEASKNTYRQQADALGSGATGWNLFIKQGLTGVLNMSTLQFSNGTPSNALGKDGEFCLDHTGFLFYGPKTGGAWGTGTQIETAESLAAALANIPAGPAGAPGQQGVKGDTGDIGPIGATGSPGVKGDTGDIGPIGATGANGTLSGGVAITDFCTIKLGSAQSINSGSGAPIFTTLNFDTLNTGNTAFLSSSDKGYKIPTGKSGYYQIYCKTQWVGAAQNNNQYEAGLNVYKNGVLVDVNDSTMGASSGVGSYAGVNNRAYIPIIYLIEGDIITFKVMQYSTSNDTDALSIGIEYTLASIIRYGL